MQDCSFAVGLSSADLILTILLFTDMREASRRLSQSLFDSYEVGWAGEEDLGAIVEVRLISIQNMKPRAAAALLLHISVEQKQQIHTLPGNQNPSFLPHVMHN